MRNCYYISNLRAFSRAFPLRILFSLFSLSNISEHFDSMPMVNAMIQCIFSSPFVMNNFPLSFLSDLNHQIEILRNKILTFTIIFRVNNETFLFILIQAALRVNDNASKVNQLKEEQEECENKLEKERDIWAAEMFELIAEEENMVNYIINYVKQQEIYYKTALKDIERVMSRMDDLLRKFGFSFFKTRKLQNLQKIFNFET